MNRFTIAHAGAAILNLAIAALIVGLAIHGAFR